MSPACRRQGPSALTWPDSPDQPSLAQPDAGQGLLNDSVPSSYSGVTDSERIEKRLEFNFFIVIQKALQSSREPRGRCAGLRSSAGPMEPPQGQGDVRGLGVSCTAWREILAISECASHPAVKRTAQDTQDMRICNKRDSAGSRQAGYSRSPRATLRKIPNSSPHTEEVVEGGEVKYSLSTSF